MQVWQSPDAILSDYFGNMTEYITIADIIIGKDTSQNKRHNIEILSSNDPKLQGALGLA